MVELFYRRMERYMRNSYHPMPSLGLRACCTNLIAMKLTHLLSLLYSF